MGFEHWLSEDYAIQFVVSKELEMVVDNYGYVKRMFAISTAALQAMGYKFEEKDEAIEELSNMARDVEQVNLKNLEAFFEEETDPTLINQKRERYFPSVKVNVNLIDDDGTSYSADIVIVVNEQNDGAANWYRFIGLMCQDEAEPFSLERTKK